VILFEKANPPRYKTCGGGIVSRLSNYLPSDISSSFEKEFHQIEINDIEAKFSYKIKRNYPLVYMVMRKDFDFNLLEEAKAAGTKVLENCEVNDLIENNNSVLLKTSKGEFTSDFVIGADGAQGITLKKSGIKIKKKNLPALECEIYVSKKDLEKFADVRFDFGFIPGGYAWVFPKKDHLSVGLGVFSLKERSINLNFYFTKYLKYLNLEKIINIERHGFYIPISTGKNILCKNRILLTGDAAALADPVTAEGITGAILSGQLAAESIVEGNLNSELVSFLYQQKIEKYFLPDLRAGILLSKVFYNYNFVRVFLMKRYGVKFCEIISDVISGERRYSNLIKNPFNYFKLLKYYFIQTEQEFNPEHTMQN
ncbi:MAG TPA: geranylgeranyl reductase family protein, partial [Ignavibacteriaceae bacterium]|nr:geranylgeranyl reductase family protein [Ignavibacteriaceae bacterium]